MKTKKIGVYTAFATFLTAAVLLITTCMEPLGTINSSGLNSTKPAPADMRSLVLNIGDPDISRTVLPEKPSTTFYEVIIFDDDNSTLITLDSTNNPNFANPPFSGNSEVYYLPPANYIVTVNARNTNSTGVIYATGDDIVNLTSGNDTATISLEATKTGGNGTFAWNFNGFPANQTSVSMNLVNLDGGAVPTVSTVNLTGSTPIASGQYRVTLRFVNSDGEHFDSVYENIVHIWNDMTTTWRRTTPFPPLNKSVHTVTYNLNSGNWDSVDEPTNLDTLTATGGTLKVNHGNHAVEPNEEPVRAGFNFDGWFPTAPVTPGSAPTGNQWAFGTALAETILANRTLYAKWDSGTNNQLTISISMFTDPTDLAPTQSGTTTLLQSEILSGSSNAIIEINLTNSSGLNLTELRFNNSNISTNAAILIDTTNNDKVTIDFTNTAIHSTGLTAGSSAGVTHELLIVATDGTDTYGGIIIITVIED